MTAPTTTMPSLDGWWEEDAKCLGHIKDEDGDHPYDLSLPKHRGTNLALKARMMCSGCPVTRECAAYALSIRATEVVMAGVWIKDPPGGHQSYSKRESTRKLQHIARGGDRP